MLTFTSLGSLGNLGYTQGVDYTCNAQYCQGLTQPVISAFKAFQRTVNAYADTQGFAQVNVDGRIGPLTYTGAVAAANSVGVSTNDFSNFQELARLIDTFGPSLDSFVPTSKEVVNQTEDAFSEVLDWVGGWMGADDSAPPSPAASVVSNTPVNATPVVPQSNTRWLLAIVGIAVVAGLVLHHHTKLEAV